jgi:zinc/manganese transport system substrate-binding protein
MTRRSLLHTFLVCAAAAMVAAGCSSDDTASTADTSSSTAPSGTVAARGCPVEAVNIVVTVDQWGDIVEDLAGDCGVVTTIITGAVDDPHDYEPTPGDSAAFGEADLVVMNGVDYDHWAEDAIDVLSNPPAVIDGGEVVGVDEGANPHLWYSPTYVYEIADAVTAELGTLLPGATDYLAERSASWRTSMAPYDQEIASIRNAHSGASYAATEAVFAYMAEAIGLVDLTPEGYATSAANESEPAPGDVLAFEQLLQGGDVEVLVYNVQTEGALTEQIRSRAVDSSVPVVDVTETVPAGVDSFVEWQVAQLQALSAALTS